MKNIIIIIALLFGANLKAQTYGTAGISWGLNGNRILDRNYIGTNNLAPLNFKTSGILSGYFDTDQSLYLLNVPELLSPDSVLTISDGQVRKTLYFPTDTIYLQNGLNQKIGGFGELGGFLIRSTQIDTKQFPLEIFKDASYNVCCQIPQNLAVNSLISPLQTEAYNNLKVQTNPNKNQTDFSKTRDFLLWNQYSETSLSGTNWGEFPIINFHSGITRAVGHNKDSVATVNANVNNNVINASITTTFDTWTDYTLPTTKRFINAYIGYRLPYDNNLDANVKFTTRAEMVINPAPDNTVIPNSLDLYISNGQLSEFNSDFINSEIVPITGQWSIYQDNKKPNLFNGNIYAKRALILPTHANSSLSQNVKGNIFFDESDAKMKLVKSVGTIKKILEYDTQTAIPNPTGGSVVDVEARAAIVSILNVMRTLNLIAP